MTHTYAILSIIASDYDDIKKKLEDAGYQHTFMENGIIDMHGIGLKRGPDIDLTPPGNPDFMADIEAFHQKFGLLFEGKPRILDPELFSFRYHFIKEELQEYADPQDFLFEEASLVEEFRDQGNIVEGLEQQLDALVDLTYVVLGTAYLQFGPKVFREAWRRVQAANMAKVRRLRVDKEDFIDSGRAVEFDVVKPAGWTAPDHKDLVEDHAHR